jgi:hypothetical protein
MIVFTTKQGGFHQKVSNQTVMGEVSKSFVHQ